MGTKNMITRTFEVAAGSDIANQVGIEVGEVRVHAGLRYCEGNADTHVSVTVDILERGKDVGGGCDHKLAVACWPELASVVGYHLWGPRTGPIHYIANAVYWWELAMGYSKWSPDPGQDPAAIFVKHTHWGSVSGDTHNPLDWTLKYMGLDVPPDGEGWVCLGGEWARDGKPWRAYAISIIRGKLKERLEQRRRELLEGCWDALEGLGLDPTWNPQLEAEQVLLSELSD